MKNKVVTDDSPSKCGLSRSEIVVKCIFDHIWDQEVDTIAKTNKELINTCVQYFTIYVLIPFMQAYMNILELQIDMSISGQIHNKKLHDVCLLAYNLNENTMQ